MGSIKSFLDWVKGGDAEDDYEEDMSRQPAQRRTCNK